MAFTVTRHLPMASQCRSSSLVTATIQAARTGSSWTIALTRHHLFAHTPSLFIIYSGEVHPC
jgi:hypothetical protein